ncbi:MAG: bifunctional demethylmenaquinone methyltransferase/2-methoxy-6-polyprenyl-1,4-benzoquinol methylase UbiE [Gemmatimonadota bacterium]|jgi:demethylmenaquinone methyltransferase/2-methoxy-6-polyprenyl-1,4-benzoquinol methylase|nr:bifunctional demethylmenaquinone methyltransferase/2-methoxy-6-polyprenyl-1,4-benzoquinol methylase UbiE [Gemmatimonadota bacterium]
MAKAPSTVLPADAEKAAHVKRMFESIAPRYDLLNHVLSLNIDRSWRRVAVNLLGWERQPDGLFLDNCAGTLDLSVELAHRPGFSGTVIGSDFTFGMLAAGEEKRQKLRIEPVCADALALPYADQSFDGATVGFGVRNLADLDAGLREMARVLKPGAKLVVLEFTTPHWQPFRAIYFFYFLRILPLIGRLISSHGSAYSYLPESVLRFPEPPELATKMSDAGFEDVKWKRLSGGIAALHVGVRR